MSHERRMMLKPGDTLFAEGDTLTHVFLVDDGEIQILMKHPTMPDADPINCGTFRRCGIPLGVELLQPEDGETPRASFTVVVPPGKHCAVMVHTAEEYRRLIGGERLQWLFRHYKKILQDFVDRRDDVASTKRKSGKIVRIVTARSLSDLDYDDLPDTVNESKESVG